MTTPTHSRAGGRYARRQRRAYLLRAAVQWAAAIGLVAAIAFGSAFIVWLIIRIIAVALASVTDLPTL